MGGRPAGRGAGGRREFCAGCGAAAAAAGAAAAWPASAAPGPAPGARAAGAWSDRQFAAVMECGMADYERVIAPVKRDLFADLGGTDVVEVGMGAGPSLPLFREAGVRSVHGIEPNLDMHPMAKARAEGCGLHRLALSTGVAEQLPLEDNSCDVLVATMLMCSVASQREALKEFARVLRPGGRYIFVEHVAAPPGSALRGLQGALNVPQQLMCHGCHLTRSSVAELEAEPSFRGRVHARRFTLGAPAGSADAWVWEPARDLAALQTVGGVHVSGVSQGWKPADGLPPPHFLLSPHEAGVAFAA